MAVACRLYSPVTQLHLTAGPTLPILSYLQHAAYACSEGINHFLSRVCQASHMHHKSQWAQPPKVFVRCSPRWDTPCV